MHLYHPTSTTSPRLRQVATLPSDTPPTRPLVASLVWSRPASRCFPSCSDVTHPLTPAESGTKLATAARGFAWTWGANRDGMRFNLSDDSPLGLLVTPWGHGEWGVVPSRPDVLYAEFAQQRHMLRFDPGRPAFISTRCSDGDTVRGDVLGNPRASWNVV